MQRRAANTSASCRLCDDGLDREMDIGSVVKSGTAAGNFPYSDHSA